MNLSNQNKTQIDYRSIEKIKHEYLKNDIPWFIGYSGGKDSSSVLKLVFNAMLEIDNFHKPITVLYVDTGVENPIVSNYVYKTFELLKEECLTYKIPLEFRIILPVLNDRFFVKVIGRGYPTPTNIFRWCTDKLRIKPVKQLIKEGNKSIILLGIRNSESEQRDRAIEKHKTNNDYILKQNGSSNNLIFSPILFHSLEHVWMTLYNFELPKSIKHSEIRKIYQDAELECPTYREKNGSPCGSSRFGCWTCTVVRKDKSVGNMIENGHSELKELYEFRNWIFEFRDDKKYRCSNRRNGSKGLGPFTLEGRKIILEKLQKIESKTGYKLLFDDELTRIYELWEIDKNNKDYFENDLLSN